MDAAFTHRMYHEAPSAPRQAQRRSPSQTLELVFACATVFLAPMNFFRLPGFYFTASDAFACLCLLMMLINGSFTLRPLGPGTAYWLLGLVLMTGGLMVSSLLIGDPNRALVLCGQYLFAYLVLPTVLLARPWSETTVLIRVFVGAVVIMVLHGIYVIDIVGERYTAFVSGSGRLTGLVERENEFGSVVALTVPLLIAMGMARVIHPVLGLALLPLLTYGIMLTGSNTALFALIYGLGFVILFRLTFVRIGLAVIALLALWFIGSTSGIREHLPDVFQRRVLNSLETGNVEGLGTFLDRMHLIHEALTIADRTTLLGLGADQYREVSEFGAPVHNLYLLLWTEGGLPALIGFLIMLTGGVIVAFRTFRLPEGTIFALCALASLTLFAGVINAAPHVYGRFWAVPLILSLAPGISLMRKATADGHRLPPSR